MAVAHHIPDTRPTPTTRTDAPLHPTIIQVTERIAARSTPGRRAYLERIDEAIARARANPRRTDLACPNLAHGMAACSPEHKALLSNTTRANIAIVTAYNDVLSAHQPFETYPAILKEAVARLGAMAQVAGGVPAMCDGITQGRAGMQLSLFSRDVIAMSTAIALSHDMFDGAVLLGVCDKITPGMLAGALSFGELPALFAPSGPMGPGLPNEEKTRVRERFAAGEIGREELLEAESKAYHSPGTCTFYGTANSNQMVMEVMGLHLPGSTFINPDCELRRALTTCAGLRVVEMSDVHSPEFTPLGHLVDEKVIVNGLVGLLATGGSTNHTMHLVAAAAAAGITVTWDDFADLSAVVPLLARIYPNGPADINRFHHAGGTGFLISELLDAHLLHPNVLTVAGPGLDRYRFEPHLVDGTLVWEPTPRRSSDETVLRPCASPFTDEGGLRILSGNLGRAVMKVSSVSEDHRIVEAPARVFSDQGEVHEAFSAGELDRDVVVVVRHQGPAANGMPELHKLTPLLGLLQRRGRSVALVTDGRMSGASGQVPIAMHVSPEAACLGPIARVEDGDVIRLDSISGSLDVLVPAEEFAARPCTVAAPSTGVACGSGRELFEAFRRHVSSAEAGATVVPPPAHL